MSKNILLSIIIPVYNEEDVLCMFMKRVSEVIKKIHNIKAEYIFINDGSTDDTLINLIALKKTYPQIKIIDLSRNFGKEAAMTAGLQYANGSIIIPIDADLQDPPELIPEMISKWQEGFDVVLAHRSNRDSDSFLKRFTARCFYWLNNKISTPHIPDNVGDYRLISRPVVDALNTLPESKRFMKGLFAWVGFKTTQVDYVRDERAAGESKFNGWKLWNFALEGLTSFGTVPLRIWTYVGALVAGISFILTLKILIQVIFLGIDVPGYASIMVAVTFLGGLQLIGIGTLGEYLGRAYMETKNRPIFIVRKIL
ncbi:glycosyltransferase family 2 protein [Maridesulfovibrio hydrothermalis]|uniref:Bactoprenol glucosyl transferase CPS-53 (KpLE1) prophage n=1 Tax=Maridesulfovibrio hydrothermalis AM13 = DSM 14728 TaxID=1121451 RepID=L0R7K0_9BACT|nr:glycosyltransferase family 2 protein [Maridesulfovibrio hydrothermalis]CCO22197.1 bactoprenol glucosyl transferase; CPS-53 (KpLE1) prophage [Maridesulfovibrio hydrothermalis AM13 = DSM 14728]